MSLQEKLAPAYTSYSIEFPHRRDKLPYTLLLKPQSGEYGQTVEVDLVPALMVANSKLPAKVRARLDHIQAGREIASAVVALAHYSKRQAISFVGVYRVMCQVCDLLLTLGLELLTPNLEGV